MEYFFICNQEIIDSKLLELIKTGTSDDGWTDCYTEKDNDIKWVLTRYHSEYHGGGISVLKRLPLLSISQLIEIALTSKNINDITGASLELYERERHHKEDFREQLIQKIQLTNLDELTEFEKERLKIIISESALANPTNKKEIIGKHWTEINKDSDYYKNISTQAMIILNKIKD